MSSHLSKHRRWTNVGLLLAIVEDDEPIIIQYWINASRSEQARDFDSMLF